MNHKTNSKSPKDDGVSKETKLQMSLPEKIRAAKSEEEKKQQLEDMPEGKCNLPNKLTDLRIEGQHNNKDTDTISRESKKEDLGKLKKSRGRRDTKEEKAEEIKTEKDNEKTVKTPLRLRLKDLQIMETKVKPEEKETKNMLKQEHKEKVEKQLASKMKDIAAYTSNKDNEEKKSEVHEKLQLLKEKLAHVKKLGEDKRNMAKEREISKLGQKIKTRLSQIQENVNKKANSQPNVAQERGKNDEVTTPAKVAKRSLVDQRWDVFGNYKPITPNLKAWKPSDILSLKRDVNFLTLPRLKPANDFQMFKNVIPPNKYLDFRRKRSVGNLNDLNNEIDTYMNDIEKDDVYVAPYMRKEQVDYKLKFSKENENKENVQAVTVKSPSGKTKEETLASSKTTSVSTPNIIEKEKRDDLDSEDNITSVVNRMSNNIQKIKGGQSFVDNVISSISGFFSNIGETLEKYIKNVA